MNFERAADERPNPESGAIKGAAFREFLRWYSRSGHLPSLKTALGRMPSELAKEFELGSPYLGLIATNWYRSELIHSLLDALFSSMPASMQIEIATAGAQAVTRSTINGVHKGLTQILESPERYAKYAQRIWEAYYDSGEYTVRMLGETGALCSIERWRGHHPFSCLLVRGALLSIYETMRCKNVRVQRRCCVAEGADRCEFRASWDSRIVAVT